MNGKTQRERKLRLKRADIVEMKTSLLMQDYSANVTANVMAEL